MRKEKSMRMLLGSVAITAAGLLLAGCGDGGVSKASASDEAKAVVKVTAVGCPVRGDDPACLILEAKGVDYDISAAGVDLSRGVGISLTGAASGQTNACGAELNNVKFDYLSLACTAPDAAKPTPAA
jgi:hypothetical protein